MARVPENSRVAVFGPESRIPTLPELLAAYGVREEYMPPRLFGKLQDVENNIRINAVDEITTHAQQIYRQEVEQRKQAQLQKHCESTGQSVADIDAVTMRKLTNRATAGAGKTRFQYLLKALDSCARNLSHDEHEFAIFLYQVMKQNYYHVLSGRAGMISAPENNDHGMGNTISEEVLEGRSGSEQVVIKRQKIVIVILSIVTAVLAWFALHCRKCTQ